MLKEWIRQWLEIEEKKKDPHALTEAELWVQSELEHHKMIRDLLTFDCFGLHYSERYLRTHPAEEVYAQWKQDIDRIHEMIDKYREEREERDAAEKAEAERIAAKKAAKEKAKLKRKRRRKRKKFKVL